MFNMRKFQIVREEKDKVVNEVGLITYHAAYNYGSVLQAWATQHMIEQLGYNCKIINYRMKSQKAHYSLVRLTGPRAFVNALLMLPVLNKKRLRAIRFETFIADYMNLTDEKLEPESICLDEMFTTVVSGSDQIWNKYSNELCHVGWRYMYPYLLKGFNGKKISYASSISNMGKEDIKKILNDIQRFDHLSFREGKSAELISGMLHRNVTVVLDPTFLLDRKQWISSFDLKEKDEKKYVLFYSLTDKTVIERARGLLNNLHTVGYQIKYITPYAKMKFSDGFEDCRDYGPLEFLDALFNADKVITDSYHGTILSINLGKEFYSINGQYDSDIRKLDVLSKLDLNRRIISWDEEYEKLDVNVINYTDVYNKLNSLRKTSVDYLEKALKR